MLFAINGAAFASWVPRIHDVKAEFGLSDPALGLALAGMATGALAISPVAGRLVSRFGSRAVSLLAAVALCGLLPLVGVARTAPVLFDALLLVGLADALCDIGMNAHSLAVQNHYERPILSAFHAWWSIGAVTGAAAGALASAAGVAVATHLSATSLVLLAVVIGSWAGLLPAAADRSERGSVHGARPNRALVMIGLIALLGALVEDAPASWSGIYLREDLGAAPGASGAAYVAFSTAMVAGRLVGDRVIGRWGAVRVTRAGGLLAAAGVAAALTSDSVTVAVAGFAVAGVGACTLFPVAFGAAGSLPGPSGAGVASVSLIARMGFLVGPALTGALSGAIGLRLALLTVVAAALTVTALAGTVAPRGA